MLFCTEADLAVLEPGVFGGVGLESLLVMSGVSGTLTGTGLTISGASFVTAGVAAGMVMSVGNATGTAAVIGEVIAVTGGTTATVGAVRVRDGTIGEAAVPVVLSGAVKVSVLNLRGQIAVVGDELLAAVGVDSDRVTEAGVAYQGMMSWRRAATVGTLALVYGMLAEQETATKEVLVKYERYAGAYAALKRGLVAEVDRDGDGKAETRVYAGVRELRRG